jgi:hypothetical protein
MVGHGQKPPVYPATSPSPHRHVWHGGDTPMATLRNERRGGPIPRSASDTPPSDNALCAQPVGVGHARGAPCHCHALAASASSSPGTAKLPASRRVGPSGCRVHCGAVYKDGRRPAAAMRVPAEQCPDGYVVTSVGGQSVRPTRRRVGGDRDFWTQREHARVVTSTGRKSCCLAGCRDPISLQKLAVLHVGPLVP